MDDKKKVGTSGIHHINTKDKYEIEYWSMKLGITPEELLKAVEEVGNSSIDVKKHIKNDL